VNKEEIKEEITFLIILYTKIKERINLLKKEIKN
jgi:hypothetical protein